MSGKDTAAFFLYEATLALYPAAGGAALWWGAAATGLTLTDTLEGVLLAASGDAYETEHHVDETHQIEIARTWVTRTRTSPADFLLARNQQYTLQITWAADGAWFQRTYYGVTAQRARQQSRGTLESLADLQLRAQYFTPANGTGGTTGGGAFTPAPPSGEAESLAFFHEAVAFTGDYLLGHYVFAVPIAGVSATVIGWAPQNTAVVLGLEVGGVLSGFTVTLPVGAANTEVTGSVSLAGLTIPAGATVRWRVVSGPADGASAAWEIAVVMRVAA